MTNSELTALLKREMIPALGCTGPTAYALATACCRPFLTAAPREVTVYVSPAFLKIGFGVATPGTTEPGIPIAAALGLVGGDYTLGLQVLKPCTDRDVKKAGELEKSGLIKVLCAWEKTGVYVRAEVTTDHEKVVAVVEHTHDGVSLIEVNGEKKLEKKVCSEADLNPDPERLTLEDIFSYVNTVDTGELRFLLDGYIMSLKLAEDGLVQGFGLKSGRAYLGEIYGDHPPDDLYERPMKYLPADILKKSKILVAAASDARMGGSRLPAMAAMGDGNQGLTALLPVGIVAESLKKSEDETIRALALSCLMLFYVKMHVGRASAFCLCAIAASAGASAGCAYLKGANEKQLRASVKNSISPLCGMLCDGAKNACALKMAIAATTAISSVALAFRDVECGFYDGVADDTLEETITCITDIAAGSMDLLDRAMVDGILKKSERRRLETPGK